MKKAQPYQLSQLFENNRLQAAIFQVNYYRLKAGSFGERLKAA
jgi:hypothetical protein